MLTRLAAAGGAALLIAGSALAQFPSVSPPSPTPAPAAEPAPAAASSATGAMTTWTNATQLKALFEEAGVPVEVKTTDKGYTFLVGRPQGYIMVVYPADCKGDSATGQCAVVALESGIWNKAITVEDANRFNTEPRLANAVIYEGNESKPAIEYTISLGAGVGPDYMRTAFRFFTNDMIAFQQYIDSLGAAGPQGGSTPGGFAVEKPTEIRAGAPSEYAVTTGKSDFRN
ncbi:MAG: YbjN domain-containing protein [Alphaproteobacteria bacterium]|nr:YbjN domain-containing protein [Alphaproteobacteria bacterium]